MRDLMYKLEDGTVVKTMKEAKESGKEYEVFLAETKKDVKKVSASRLKYFGLADDE